MDNPQIELARKIIETTDTSLFLTGKAGTGKTTFLRRLRSESPKRMVVLAPTGIAAINAGGTTIHSFFQLSLPLCAWCHLYRKTAHIRHEQAKNQIVAYPRLTRY